MTPIEQQAREWAEKNAPILSDSPVTIRNEVKLHRMAKRAYLAGHTEATRWIPVSEGLPEPFDENIPLNNRVLAKVDGQINIMCLDVVHDDDGKCWVWANCYGSITDDPVWDDDYEVTEWRYILPPSPKK